MSKLTLLLAAFLPAAAFAEGAPAAGGAGIEQLIFLGGFVLIFYFLLWRPQSKRAKEHKALLGSLEKGSEVVTSGGILGRVTKVTDDFAIIKVAEGVELPVQKQAVSAVLPKGTIKSISE
ncbi:MAG: preprotein translocase subunit YajC [Oceanicoccus sp.]|jgi:preprotein translocase subunit YajC